MVYDRALAGPGSLLCFFFSEEWCNEKVFAAVLLLLSLLLGLSAFAQTSNATLGGTVSDSTGALIPGVSMTATNTQTGVVTTVISNEAGAYQFASLQPGSYKVSAELGGFQTQVSTMWHWNFPAGPIELRASGRRRRAVG